MLGRSRLMMAAALMGALSSLGAMAGIHSTPMVIQGASAAVRKSERSGTGVVSLAHWGYLRHGPTMAQQKRASKKARNVKRHKAACRK